MKVAMRLFSRLWARRRRGFTLVEMLVVVVILAILAGVAVGVVPAAVRRAKRSALVSTLAVLQEAVHRFYAESNVYPCAVQPTEAAAQQLDLNATDARGATFLEGYIRFAPETRARALGLDPDAGETVYYGIAYCGRVFATQVAPQNGAWTDGNTLVWVQNNPWRPYRLADICGMAGGTVPGSPYSITLWANTYEAQPGQSITVYGRVVDSANKGVPNVKVRVDITGSVTGRRSVEVTTAQDGTFSVEVKTDTPEYVVVSATVIG